jgi:hypothetical protein
MKPNLHNLFEWNARHKHLATNNWPEAGVKRM